MRFVASIELQTKGGIWVTLSAIHDDRLAAFKWAENLAWKAYRRGIPTRSLKVNPYVDRRPEPGQFDFLRGNEACAKEWQDSRQ